MLETKRHSKQKLKGGSSGKSGKLAGPFRFLPRAKLMPSGTFDQSLDHSAAIFDLISTS